MVSYLYSFTYRPITITSYAQKPQKSKPLFSLVLVHLGLNKSHEALWCKY